MSHMQHLTLLLVQNRKQQTTSQKTLTHKTSFIVFSTQRKRVTLGESVDEVIYTQGQEGSDWLKWLQ